MSGGSFNFDLSDPDSAVLISLISNRMIAKLVELGHDSRDVQEAADTWNDYSRCIFYSTTPLSDYGASPAT